MLSSSWKVVVLCFIVITGSLCLQAQTTYHLHDDSGVLQLKTAGPDRASIAVLSQNLKGVVTGEYLIQQFPTASGVPNSRGLIPSGSTVNFTLWMRKTASAGTMFPRAKLFRNGTSGTQICSRTGSTALTTTLTKLTFSCTTSSNITFASSDTLLLWVGINLTATTTSSVMGQLSVEGLLNGNSDSQVVVHARVLGVAPLGLVEAEQRLVPQAAAGHVDAERELGCGLIWFAVARARHERQGAGQHGRQDGE